MLRVRWIPVSLQLTDGTGLPVERREPFLRRQPGYQRVSGFMTEMRLLLVIQRPLERHSAKIVGNPGHRREDVDRADFEPKILLE